MSINASKGLLFGEESEDAMQDHDFTSSSHKGSPYYYVLIEGDAPIGQIESRYFRFETAREAAALYRFLAVDRQEKGFSLGVHKDYTRRADIVKRVDGTNVLDDSVFTTAPWKNDPRVAKDVADLSSCLGVAWKIDREFVGKPILIPNERAWVVVPAFLEGKTLRPDAPEDPKSSIREASIQGLGWMSFSGLRSHADSCSRGVSSKPPLVEMLLIDYEVVGEPGCGSIAITPHEYRLLEDQYLTQQKGREASRSTMQTRPLDDLKNEAKARIQSNPRSASKASKEYGHVL